MYTGGKIGEFFAALAFASALVALISLLFAEREKDQLQNSWERMGLWAFGTHILSIFGVIGTLFYLIYTHQYQYHYVWSHSSNELPVYYMISCFWEGQEGSFLLWCFWHVILGGILMRKKTQWRNTVLAVIASVELILTSMFMGIYVDESWVSAIYGGMILLPMAWLGYKWVKEREGLPYGGTFHLAGVLMALSIILLLGRDQAAFASNWSLNGGFAGLPAWGFTLLLMAGLGYLVFFFAYLSRSAQQNNYHLSDITAGLGIFLMAVVAMWFEPDVWKIGSNPFISLRDAMPNAPEFQSNPNFVPANGSGLNSLLQNYWMVIHPPTLFLGFASTVVPFAFVMAGLIKGKYQEWIRPAMPWNSFSVMILGVGIIMGGYWAYETLNFGGYWNWDPVENSSFVPWLCGVASLHTLLIYQRSKAYLKMGMILIMSTFLLVLYSTYLTRSGILGETSVHTFTDLGLSFQLRLLVLLYVALVVVGLLLRWKDIPEKEAVAKVWTPEFMLFLGLLTLIFAGLVIILTTSLPVFNWIFGTRVAPPPDLQLFYYQWIIWFAIGFGVLSAIAQFLWWKIGAKKSTSNALFIPFAIAAVSTIAVMGIIISQQMEFAFNDEFQKILAQSGGGISKAVAYVKFTLVSITDELLLFGSLFTIIANGYVLVKLLQKNKKGLKVMGGTVVHIGFGLMLIGMLFSSGYDEVISKNMLPEDLAAFPEQERMDNVPLLLGQPRIVKDYWVTYVGKKEASGPIQSLDLLEDEPFYIKVRFWDKENDAYMITMPRWDVFVEKNVSEVQKTNDTSDPHGDSMGIINLDAVKIYLERNLVFLNAEGLIKQLDNRQLYGIQFTSLKNPRNQFLAYPESENNEGGEGMISHPDRKVYWDNDVYLYVSSMPTDEEKPEYDITELELGMGERTRMDNIEITMSSVKQIESGAGIRPGDMAFRARVDLVVAKDTLNRFLVGKNGKVTPYRPGLGVGALVDTFTTYPTYIINKGNTVSYVPDKIRILGMEILFHHVDPQAGKFHFRVFKQKNKDWIVVKAIRKPLINILWLGTFILTIGFLISIYRRVQENRRLGS